MEDVSRGWAAMEMTNGSVTTRRKFSGEKKKRRRKKREKEREKKSCSPIEAPFLSIHSSCPSPALSISFHRDTKIVSSGPTELEGFLRPTKGCSTSRWQRTQNGGPDTGTPVEWPYKENALNSSGWSNPADERKTHMEIQAAVYVQITRAGWNSSRIPRYELNR